jgi:tRNA 2-thiouridine synthesizing protein A
MYKMVFLKKYFLKENTMSDVKVAPDGLAVAAVLDARGLSCPMPLLRTKKEIGKIKSGEILHIQGTDPGSRNDIPGWCERAGHEYLGEKEESGYISFFIKKG